MDLLNEKLRKLDAKIKKNDCIKVAILGLGSVGAYLLEYLLAWPFDNVQIHIGVRNQDKAQSDVNIARVSQIIRTNSIKKIQIHRVDLDSITSIENFFEQVQPDFTVNSSRVYSGLKYGSISWKNIRAYGLWIPLSVKYIKNIMYAYQRVGSNSIVINTSYSDGTNAWLKSAELPPPDFGSGNLNHLIPRIKLAVQQNYSINSLEDIEVVLATSHFHDVLISKEGQTGGLEPLIHLSYLGKKLEPNMQDLYSNCAISMPVNEKRNMMNAGSNFEIIKKIVCASSKKTVELIHSPGAVGFIGGYPLKLDFSNKNPITFVEDYFSLQEMTEHNKKSIALDGIGEIEQGRMHYTPKLVNDVFNTFGLKIPASVHLDDSEEVADLIIEGIIKKQVQQ